MRECVCVCVSRSGRFSKERVDLSHWEPRMWRGGIYTLSLRFGSTASHSEPRSMPFHKGHKKLRAFP
jgi:hypothetical protein